MRAPRLGAAVLAASAWKAAVTAAVLFSIVVSGAGADQRILPLGSPAYEALRGLYLEQGLAPPSSSYPYSYGELRSALKRLDFGFLSAGGKRTYRLLEALRDKKPRYEEAGGFRFYTSFEVNTEFYLHTDRDFETWTYDEKKRRPFLSATADAVFFDTFNLYMDLAVQKDAFQTGGDPDNYTSILTSPFQFDLTVPHRAALSFGGPNWNLWAGRDNLSWGGGRTGNLLLSDADLYQEGLRFTTFWDRFKFTFLILGLESWTSPECFGPGYSYPDGIDPANLERFKMFLAHRLEFLLRPDLRFTMNESIVYGGKYPDLRVFNPMILYHNLYIKEVSNSLISFELEYTPFRGLLLYGQFAMDQFSTLFEQEAYGIDSEPNAMGYLAGLEYRLPAGDGGFTFSYEFVYTDPWLYIREHPLVSFVSTRRVQSEARKKVLGDKNYTYRNSPIGYAGGPDLVVNSLLLSYDVADRYGVSFEGRLSFSGENELTGPFFTGDPAWALTTPSGKAETAVALTLGGWYRFSAEISAFLEASFVYNGDKNHVRGKTAADLQLAAGFRYTLE
jgi:hypothetical protein